MTMENLPARLGGAGPLADYSIGMRVQTLRSSQTPHDETDCGGMQAELLSKAGVGHSARSMETDDFRSLVVGDFGSTVGLPFHSRRDLSPLGVSISVVVGVGADEPVCWVLAGRVVAGVADLFVGSEGPNEVLESPAMSETGGAGLSSEGSVPLGLTESSPRPALVWSAQSHFGPVPIFDVHSLSRKAA
jgi:hypothetical protein